MQPPETDPVTCPSARIASQEPTGRGDEPQVCTTVAIAICSPACSQATAVFKTLKSFYQIRALPGLKKKPSTSELIDWLKLLLAEDIAPAELYQTDENVLIPPLHGALLKNEQDLQLFERLVLMNRNHR